MSVRGSKREVLGEPRSPSDSMLEWAEAGGQGRRPATAAGLEHVVESSRALIVELMDGYLIPTGDANLLLIDVFRHLSHRWGRLARPVIWLVLRINHGCVNWWRQRLSEQLQEQGGAGSVASAEWRRMLERVEVVIAWRLSRRLRRTPDISPEHPRDPEVAEIEPARWSDARRSCCGAGGAV